MAHHWNTSTRRDSLPPGWDHIRARILKRDAYACTVCGHVATEVDHIQRGAGEGDENLTSLCRTHHAHKSSLEGHDAMRHARQQTKRPTPRHPGLT